MMDINKKSTKEALEESKVFAKKKKDSPLGYGIDELNEISQGEQEEIYRIDKSQASKKVKAVMEGSKFWIDPKNKVYNTGKQSHEQYALKNLNPYTGYDLIAEDWIRAWLYTKHSELLLESKDLTDNTIKRIDDLLRNNPEFTVVQGIGLDAQSGQRAWVRMDFVLKHGLARALDKKGKYKIAGSTNDVVMTPIKDLIPYELSATEFSYNETLDKLEKGSQINPIEVIKVDDGYVVINGNSRAKAYKDFGKHEIPTKIIEVTRARREHIIKKISLDLKGFDNMPIDKNYEERMKRYSNIFHYSKSQIENISPEPNAVLISIAGVHDGFAKIDENLYKNVLRLRFSDVKRDLGKFLAFKESQAEQILSFIYKNNPENIYINCEQGKSRSAGVHLALEKICNKRVVYLSTFNSHVSDVLLKVAKKFNKKSEKRMEIPMTFLNEYFGQTLDTQEFNNIRDKVVNTLEKYENYFLKMGASPEEIIQLEGEIKMAQTPGIFDVALENLFTFGNKYHIYFDNPMSKDATCTPARIFHKLLKAWKTINGADWIPRIDRSLENVSLEFKDGSKLAIFNETSADSFITKQPKEASEIKAKKLMTIPYSEYRTGMTKHFAINLGRRYVDLKTRQLLLDSGYRMAFEILDNMDAHWENSPKIGFEEIAKIIDNYNTSLGHSLYSDKEVLILKKSGLLLADGTDSEKIQDEELILIGKTVQVLKERGFPITTTQYLEWLHMGPGSTNSEPFDKVVLSFLGEQCYNVFKKLNVLNAKLRYELGLGAPYVDGIDLSIQPEISNVPKVEGCPIQSGEPSSVFMINMENVKC